MYQKILPCLLAVLLLMTACTQESAGGAPESTSGARTTIALADGATKIDGPGAAADGDIVTIAGGGTYHISGTLTNGQLVVDANDADVTLVLDGANITNSAGSAVYGKQANHLTVTLSDGSENTLADIAGGEADREDNAALYSADDMTITGAGSLTVAGNYENGIIGKDDLVIESGNITVDALHNGIRGRDSLTITGGVFSVTAGNDALQSNNDSGAPKGQITLTGGDFTLDAAHDGVQAEAELVISGGTYQVTSGGGNAAEGISSEESYKGFKSATMIHITGGTFTVDSADDAFHSNGDITIENGTFVISTGDDAVHADGDLTVLDGSIQVLTAYEGLESMTMTLAGGEIDIHATDDGINVAGGTDSNGQGRFGPDMFAGGQRPEWTGEMQGERTPPQTDTPPEMPEGADVPTPPEGAEPPAGGMGSRDTESRWLKITGGNITITVKNGDGIDINGNGEMTGGTVYTYGMENGPDSGLDFDGSFQISGGTLVATGSSQMAQAPGEASEQPSLMLYLSQTYPAGSTVTVADASGTVLLESTLPQGFANFVYSSAQLTAGETYTVSIDGQTITSITLDGMLTRVSDTGEAVTGGMGFGGGFGGGGGRPGGGFGGGTRPTGGFGGERPEGEAPQQAAA